MKTIKNRFFKILAVVLAAFGITTTFTACYGVVENEGEIVSFSVSFRVKGDINGDGIVDENEVVPNIMISGTGIGKKFEEHTDSNGLATVNFYEYRYSLDGLNFNFKDIDGKENGAFKDEYLKLKLREDHYTYADPTYSPNYMEYEKGKVYEITLTPKTESDKENVPDESDETSEETTDETTENTDDSENQ